MKNQKLLGFLAASALVLGGLAACGSGDIEDAGEMDDIYLESAESILEGYVDDAITAYQECESCDATGETVEVSSESEEASSEASEETSSEASDGGTTEASSTSTETSSATTEASSSAETTVSSSSVETTVSSSSTATVSSSSEASSSSSSVVSSSSEASSSSSSVVSSSSEASSSSSSVASSSSEVTDGSTIDVTSSYSGSLTSGTYTITGITNGLAVNGSASSCTVTIDGTEYDVGWYLYISGLSSSVTLVVSDCTITQLSTY